MDPRVVRHFPTHKGACKFSEIDITTRAPDSSNYTHTQNKTKSRLGSVVILDRKEAFSL